MSYNTYLHLPKNTKSEIKLTPTSSDQFLYSRNFGWDYTLTQIAWKPQIWLAQKKI